MSTGLGAPPKRAPDTGRRVPTTGPGPAVVGLGYVGLPTALSLAAAGHDVLGVDVSAGRLEAIHTLRVDLPSRARRELGTALEEGRLDVSVDLDRLVAAGAVVICVPTPLDENRLPDLAPLHRACAEVVSRAVPGQTIVLTSTSYVGCTRDLLVGPLAERGLVAGEDVHVAFSPERIDPGVPGHEPRSTPRVVGGVTPECTRRATELLGPTAASVHPVGSPEVAELSKLLENTFRAVNIALANEFADVARELGVDAAEVVRAAATKPYGFMAFRPGPGVGGHCIPCDPHYLLWQLRRRSLAPAVTTAAMTTLADRPRAVCRRIREVLADSGRTVARSRILVLGVTYKPGVADVRESPALAIIEELRSDGARVAFSDPLVERIGVGGGGQLTRVADPGAVPWDLVVVHTLDDDADLRWLARCRAVLDTTYRLSHLPHGRTL